MAGLTKARRAERDAEKQVEQVDAADDGLIAMNKDGESVRVHPTCVKSHQAAGWKLEG